MARDLERYDRQIRIFKKAGQKKLLSTRVGLVGSQKVSDFMLADLLSIGIGEITRIGYSDFLEFEKINPEVYLDHVGEELCSLQLAEFHLDGKDFIIDASNNPTSKAYSLAVAKKRNIPYLSVCSSQSSFSFSTSKTYQDLIDTHEKELETEQGLLNSIVCSGIATDELRKRLVPMKDDSLLDNLQDSSIKEGRLEKKVLQIGAGAIGTFSALALSLMNAELTIVDFDVIDESNLNRQFLFYNSVGLNKAEVLTERLKKYTKKIKAINKQITGFFTPKGYDVILSCVDNNKARYYLNKVAARFNIPLINGGSSISAGNTMPYVPKKTACLDCQTGSKLTEALTEETKRRGSAACFQPSIITSNQIMGGLMVDCLLKALNGEYEKSNYSSGYGIFRQKIDTNCYQECKKSEQDGKSE